MQYKAILLFCVHLNVPTCAHEYCGRARVLCSRIALFPLKFVCDGCDLCSGSAARFAPPSSVAASCSSSDTLGSSRRRRGLIDKLSTLESGTVAMATMAMATMVMAHVGGLHGCMECFQCSVADDDVDRDPDHDDGTDAGDAQVHKDVDTDAGHDSQNNDSDDLGV